MGKIRLMVAIEHIEAVPGLSGYYCHDQVAIQREPGQDGFIYEGEPVTEGFQRIQEPGESICVLLKLSNGRTAKGDCVAVVFSGIAGRNPLFDPNDHIPVIEDELASVLQGRPAAAFEDNVVLLEEFKTAAGERLHTAVRYGVSQALLDAAAIATKTTKAGVLADAYGTVVADEPVPLYAQSGANHYENADKMILKTVDVLPHGSFHNRDEIGEEGGELLQYTRWLSDRVSRVGDEGYSPRIHLDVYGQLGKVHDPSTEMEQLLAYLEKLQAAASPYPLTVEAPIHRENRESQLRLMSRLRSRLAEQSLSIEIAADEWCNTLADVRAFADAEAVDLVQVKMPDVGEIHRSMEAVLYCEGTSVDAFLGGSANETDLSARCSAHVALASDPSYVLAKPGVSVDESLLIVENEMRRVVARHHSSVAE